MCSPFIVFAGQGALDRRTAASRKASARKATTHPRFRDGCIFPCVLFTGQSARVVERRTQGFSAEGSYAPMIWGEGSWFGHAFCSPGRAPGLPERIWPQDVSAEGNSADMIPGWAAFVPCVLFAGQGARVARERPGARFRAGGDTGNPQFGGAGRVLPRAFCAPGRTPRPLERNSAPVGMRMGASLYPMAIRTARRTRRTVEHTTVKRRGSHNPVIKSTPCRSC